MNLHDKLLRRKRKNFRVHHEEKLAKYNFSKYLSGLIPNSVQSIVLVCIGTDRSTGDSLGPLVGTRLKNKRYHLPLYGTLASPVHAINLQTYLNKIHVKHEDAFIIGIDACLGKFSNIGVVTIGDGPVKPGAGVNKQLPAVGNIHITGIVNVSGFMEHLVLQNTRLHLVMSMANFIADGILHALVLRNRKLNSLNSSSS